MEGGYQSMSNQVDNRVVSMEFYNKRFEKNVETSISTLDKLKKSLKLEGATKGLEEVDRTAKKIDMSGLSNAVETVSVKFSSLKVMAVTALANITNSAVNAGKRIVSALTIDPIKTGFSEYETQINSIQTILANTESKGSTLQDVNNALAELNTYADKTIYNFTEMTRNIGTFTAAGVDLDTSVSAIKGIANLAAVSGSTSQQASTAMYQLSQALSSGTVKLMDWNSVVNAGMGGQVFQDALKETARVHNVNIDSMIKSEGSFRETLKNGWLTSEILTETLSKFTGDLSEKQLKQMGYTDEQIAGIVKMGKTANDAATKVKTFTQLFDTLKEAAQSGWTKTWEIIVGDFGEAKDLLTEISDIFGGVIGDSADSRNKLLSGALSTGWKQLLNEGITDAAGFEERVTEVAKKHGVDLSKMINDETTFQDTLKEGWMTSEILSESIAEYGKKLKGMSEAELEAAGYTMKDVQAFEELEKKLSEGKISLEEFAKLMGRPSGRELLIESLRNSLKAVLAIISPVKKAFRDIFPATTAEQIYNVLKKIQEFTDSLAFSIEFEHYAQIERIFKGIFAALDIGVEIIKAVGGGIMDLLGYIAPAGDGFLDMAANVGDFLVKLRDSIKEGNVFGKVIGHIVSFIKTVGDGLKEFGKSISESFGKIMDGVEIRFSPLTALGNGLKAIFIGIGKVIAKAMPLVASLAKGIGTIFTSLMEKISSSIAGADYNSLFDILNGGIFSAIGVFIARFVKKGGDILDNAGGILENIKEIIGGVGDALEAFTQQLKAKTLKEIAIAIGVLAGALLVISLIDSEKLTGSLAAVTVMFAELMGAMSIFGKMGGGIKDFIKISIIAKTMQSLATALLILSVALKIMGSMSWQEMGIGLITMTAALGAMVGVIWALPKEKELQQSAKAISSFAKSLVIMAIALKIMGSMSWREMGVGLITMTAALGAMVGVIWALPKEKELKQSAKAISSFAKSLVIMAVALKIMGSMSLQEMAIGLGGMVVALGAMIGVIWALPTDVKNKATGILALSSAMVILAAALKIMGSMSLQEMAIGLGGMVVALGAMIGVIWAMPKDITAKAAGILALSSALVVLSLALKTMGSMSWGEIVRGLVTLAGAFVIMGAAAYIIGPLAPAMLSLGGAIALVGVGILAAGAGVLLFAAGLTALAAALTVSGGAIVVFVTSIISLIPFFIEQVGVGIIRLCEVIAGSVDAICAAITTIVVAVVEALVTCIPTIAEGVLKLIVGLLEILIEYLPQIVPLLVTLFVKLIDLIIEQLPTITEAIFRFIGAILTNIADNISQLIEPLVKLFGAIFQGIADVIGPVVQEIIAPLLEVILDCFVKLFEVLEPHIPMICELIAYLATVITNAIVRIFEIIAPYMPEVTRIVEIIADAVTKIIDDVVRLFEQISPILDSISNVISEAGDAIKDALDGVSGVIDSVGGLIKSFFDGISGVIDSVGNAALNAGTGFEKLANGVKIITKLNLADMAASLAAVATGLGKIAKNSDGISETGTGMKKIADSVKISESAFNSMSVGITNMIENLSSLGSIASTAMTEFTTAISNATSDLTTISLDVSTATSSITASITAMGTACVNAIESFKGRFAEAGKYLIQGLANGIRANKYVATSAAREVANAVEKIIRSAWQVNSPSKLFYKIALGVGEGIRNAFGDSVLSVKRSASDLADTANDGFSNTIRQIAEFINSDMDTQPTIRPVLDLSDVQAGANSIAGMFSGNRSLAISAPGVGAISASMANRQNGNNDLASAINKLAKSNGKSGNTYQINGINYSEGSDVADAIQTLVRAAKMEGRT